MSWFSNAFGPDPRMVRLRQNAQTDRVNLRNSAKLGIAQATGVSPAGAAAAATSQLGTALGSDAANVLSSIYGNPSNMAAMRSTLSTATPPPTAETGITAAEVGVGVVALLALGAAVYFGTK